MSSAEFASAGWANDSLRPEIGRVRVMFHAVQKKMEKASADAGTPIFKEVIHITKIPADQFLRIDRPLRETDKEEFAAEWENWQKTRENRIIGLPIEHWPSISDTQKAEFRAMNIVTVEQFAGLPDGFGQRIQGFHDLRRKALAFVESGKDAELLAKAKAEADEREARLKAEIAELRAMIEERTAPANTGQKASA